MFILCLQPTFDVSSVKSPNSNDINHLHSDNLIATFMLCLGKLNEVILTSGLESCDSCFENQNKIGFSRFILCCNRIKKAKTRIAMFSRLCTDGPKGFLLVIFICENFLLFLCKTFGLWPEWLRLKGNNFLNCLCIVSSCLNSVFVQYRV